MQQADQRRRARRHTKLNATTTNSPNTTSAIKIIHMPPSYAARSLANNRCFTFSSIRISRGVSFSCAR